MSNVKNLGILFLSILIGRVSFIGGCIPYSIALWCSTLGYGKKLSIIVGTGILTGNIMVNGIPAGMELIGTGAFIAILDMVCDHFKLKNEYIQYVKIFISVFIIKLIIILIQGILVYDLVIAFLASLMSVLMYIFFNMGMEVILSEEKNKKIKVKQMMSIMALLCFAIAGFGKIKIAGVQLTNLIGVLTVLISAKIFDIQGSIIAGVFISIISVITNDMSLNIIASYALGSILAGILVETGNTGIIIGFMLGNTIVTYLSNGGLLAVIGLKEILVASIIFVMIQKKKFKEFSKMIKNSLVTDELSGRELAFAEGVSNKLLGFSNALSELSGEIVPISQSQKVLDKKDTSKFIDKVVQRVCKDCENRHICYGTEFIDTYDKMEDLISIINKKGNVTERDVKNKFGINSSCDKTKEIAETINNIYEIYRVNMVWRKKMSENRKLISDQLKNVSLSVNKLAEQIDIDVKYKDSLELKLLYEFESKGIKLDELTVNSDKNKTEVTIYSKDCFGVKKCKNNIEKIVSDVVGKRMTRVGMICPQSIKGRCMQKFASTEMFKADVGISSISKNKEKISGDSSSVVNLDDGKVVCILSDGMGNGEKAHNNSKRVVDLLQKLLKSGFDKETAINVVNSSFMINSIEETYSTIDLTVIDLFSGKAEFVKYGACPCYIKKDYDIKSIKTISLPAGLFENVKFELNSVDLDENEYVIMVSDGVIDSNRKEDWIYKLLKWVDAYDAQQIADIIMAEALKNYNGIPEDDMTVLVIGLKPFLNKV